MLTAQGTRRETGFGVYFSILGRNLPCRSGDLGLSAGSATEAGRLRPFTLTSSCSVSQPENEQRRQTEQKAE